jgi:uncharacterized membrane protein YkvA (DUF1232 family)
VLRILISVAIGLGLTWLLFIVALLVARPRGVSLGQCKQVVPDTVRLLRSLAADSSLPPSVRRRLALLLGYLALPFDLVPDFIPVLGYADDVIVIALVLRSVVRTAGSDAVGQHWRGSAEGLLLVRRLSGIKG